MLIAALSGRALATAARRAGYAPLVADLFADLDTRAASEAHERVPGSLRHGLSGRALSGALDRLAAGRAPEGLVWGAGFEDRPALLRRLGRRTRLLGNGAETVARVKDPDGLAALCARAAVPHPEIRHAPAEGEGWLLKRAGAAGGTHIRPARPERAPPRGRYLQRLVAGRPVSALFLADGRGCLVLGFTEQWAAPAPRQPFRYGGALRPAPIEAVQEAALRAALARLVPGTGLVGLNSADFLLDGDGFHLLEINPRPGATLDVFTAPSLFDLHVRACRGELPDALPALPAAEAAAVVYAARPLRLPPGFAWPDWAADRQPPEQDVAAGAPLCTVTATADSAAAARALVARRAADILSLAENGR